MKNKKEQKRYNQRVRSLQAKKNEQQRNKNIETTTLVMRATNGVATNVERLKLRSILLEAKVAREEKEKQLRGE